ncbi:hypothetical protein I547_4948 [Mycobacterium kansasii 824]|nr:hypothetical protein I547_4948 [Mycobacterium kansasii 824]
MCRLWDVLAYESGFRGGCSELSCFCGVGSGRRSCRWWLR